MPSLPQERVQNRTLEQFVGVPVPQITAEGLPIVPQELVQNRPPEQIVGFPVPQIVQESVQNRTLEQVLVSPVPQTMEAVVEVSPPTQHERVLSRMQERVQNRPRKLFVDVPVPHIMEQTAGKVMRTGKVFTVDMRHHRGDQACPVDTVDLNIKGLVKFNMPRPGDVMVPALHMEVPSLHEAVTRFFEQHADEDGLISWDTLYASLPPEHARNLRRGGGRGAGRGGRRGAGGDLGFELIFDGYVAEIRCEGSGAWHPLDPSWVLLPVLRGRLNILGARGQGLGIP